MRRRYLLDTNICLYIAKHQPSVVREHFVQHGPDALVMSVITLGELCWGAEKSQSRDRAFATIQLLQERIQVAELTPQVGIHYGQIRSALESCGRPIGNHDLWIAAHARAEGWVLVTNNEREFQRVDGLQVENWATA